MIASFDIIKDAVSKYAEVFRAFGQWEKAIEKMADRQIIFTDTLSHEMLEKILAVDDVERIITEYYEMNTDAILWITIDRCKEYYRLHKYLGFYNEIIDAYKHGHYQLACTGLFALIDGILADASPAQLRTNPKFIKRLNALRDKMDKELVLSDLDREITSVIISLDRNEDAFFNGTQFNENENTEIVNRNWILHGRTHRIYEKIDFIKVLLLVEGIILLANTCD